MELEKRGGFLVGYKPSLYRGTLVKIVFDDCDFNKLKLYLRKCGRNKNLVVWMVGLVILVEDWKITKQFSLDYRGL